ncbi:MAG: ATP-binding protein [Spirochaetia bacterium]|nr:ATP-binding protein [Spirochaetia bacterium]
MSKIKVTQYILLILLAVLIISEFAFNYVIYQKQKIEAYQINIAGRQRMLSQKIVLNTFQFVNSDSTAKKNIFQENITDNIDAYREQLDFLLGKNILNGFRVEPEEIPKEIYYGNIAYTVRDSEDFINEVQNILKTAEIQKIMYLNTTLIPKADKLTSLLDYNVTHYEKKVVESEESLKYFQYLIVSILLLIIILQGRGFFKKSAYAFEKESKARESSEKLLKEAERIANLGSFKIDHIKNEIIWSDQKYRIYEVDKSIKPSMGLFLSKILKEDRKFVLNNYKLSLENQWPFDVEFRLKMKDGRIKHLHERMETEFDEKGRPVISIGASYDMTEYIKANEELELYRMMIEKSGDPVFLIDDDDKCKMIYVNEAAVKHYGVPKEEILKWRIPDWDPNFSYEKLDEHVEEVKKIRNLFIESEHKIKGGKEVVPVEVSLNHIEYKGRTCHFGYFKNISERKKKEDELKEAKEAAEGANKAKSDFVANMSHEIRTPMNAIIGFSDLLKEKITDSKQKGYLNSIISASKTLLTLINDILDISKIEAGKLDVHYNPFNPHELFKEMEKVFSQKMAEKNIEFIINIENSIPKGLVHDEIRIRQILLNLIGNAVKFTEKGFVKLSVTKEYTEDDKSKLDLSIIVEDSGIGISEEDKEKIFSPFLQSKDQSHAKYGGTGLGLSISKRLVEMMGGSIKLNSELGKGSKFIVNIKDIAVASIEIDRSDKISENSLYDFENSKVLVVDDIDENRELVRGYLEKYNFEILEAENGKEGVRFAEDFLPDLIFMDMRMPVMDGYEAIKILKENEKTKKIPVVALTASGMKSSEEKIKTITEGYLRKPINKNDLLGEIAKHISHTKKQSEESVSKDEYGEKEILDRFNRYILNDEKPEDSGSIDNEFILKIENEIKNAKDSLSEHSAFSDFKDFFERLESININYNNRYVLIFIDKLKYHVSLYDMNGLLNTMEHLNKLGSKIKKLIN